MVIITETLCIYYTFTDSIIYDVFFLYSSQNEEDKDFAEEILLDKLEKELDYKACLIERDSSGGAGRPRV